MKRRPVSAVLSVFLLFVLSGERGRAAEKSPAELLPATTALYVEIAHPDQLLDTVLQHPLRPKLEQTAVYRFATTSAKYRQFTAVRQIVETQLDATWQDAFKSLSHAGIVVGGDPATEGIAVFARTRDSARRHTILDKFVELVRLDAAAKKHEDPIEEHDYRGIPVRRIGDAIFAEFGEYLLITNKKDLGRQIADQYLDGSDSHLANQPSFQKAVAQRAQTSSAGWAYVDVAALRAAGVAKDLFRAESPDVAAELILGGIFAHLIKTDLATATLQIRDTDVELELATPHAADWVPATREFYWGPNNQGQAPAPITGLPNQLAGIGTYRNLSQLWVGVSDLFPTNQQVIDKLAEADSGLSNLFGGRDFGDEILGAIQPGIQFVATESEIPSGQPVPTVRLPAFALIFELKDAATMRPELRRTFQSLIGFFNIVGSTQGQPQLDMKTYDEPHWTLVTSRYLPPVDRAKDDPVAIHYNFTPSAAFIENRFILSSSEPLARQLLQIAPPGTPTRQTSPNTWGHVDAHVGREILQANRSALITQNQLKKGHTPEEARGEVDALLELLRLLSGADLTLGISDGTMALKLNIAVAN
ncbi:MAG: DUF3352 domain-containing protein [Planctomycetales bacterium]|nr:DUF3352 domain-containing protein [Planctomycetales bacterium]